MLLWSTRLRMRNPEIDYKLPRTISLLLPDSHKMTITGRLLVVDIGLGFPWSSRESQIARCSHSRKRRLPGKQWPLVGKRHRMFVHPLFPIHSAGPKQQPIIRDERHE